MRKEQRTITPENKRVKIEKRTLCSLSADFGFVCVKGVGDFFCRRGGNLRDDEDCKEGEDNSRNHFVEREDRGDKVVPDEGGNSSNEDTCKGTLPVHALPEESD